MLLYKCVRFSEVMAQMFLTDRVPCRVLSRLRLVLPLSLFISSLDLYWELGDVTPCVFSSVLL